VITLINANSRSVKVQANGHRAFTVKTGMITTSLVSVMILFAIMLSPPVLASTAPEQNCGSIGGQGGIGGVRGEGGDSSDASSGGGGNEGTGGSGGTGPGGGSGGQAGSGGSSGAGGQGGGSTGGAGGEDGKGGDATTDCGISDRGYRFR
jgi:hypothetical protein